MNNQKGIALIVIILILAAIIGGGIITWQFLKVSKEEVKVLSSTHFLDRLCIRDFLRN